MWYSSQKQCQRFGTCTGVSLGVGSVGNIFISTSWNPYRKFVFRVILYTCILLCKLKYKVEFFKKKKPWQNGYEFGKRALHLASV